jgi:hypothetical protein
MGNTTNIGESSLLRDYEHIYGKRLLAAIRLNSREEVERAIDIARREPRAPFSVKINMRRSPERTDFDEMADRMTVYLTKGYDIGDGIFFTKTPLEYCTHLNAPDAAVTIREHLYRLGVIDGAVVRSPQEGTRVSDPATGNIGIENIHVGLITHERAALARERLVAFHAKQSPPAR